MQPGADPLHFDQLAAIVRDTLGGLPDARTGLNTRYSMADIAMSAFSVFFLQCPSFLDFQRTAGREKGTNNAATLFGVNNIPTDNHTRSILDAVAPEQLYPAFDRILDRLHQTGALAQFRSINNDLLVTVDGTLYYDSENVHCPQCHVIHKSNGADSYRHMVITPAIVCPGRSDVIALSPEFIRNSDGEKKAENEIVAAKRWIQREGPRLSPLSVTVVGDDIYATQSFLELVLESEMNFLCVCKPQSHKYLTEYVESLRQSDDLDTLTATEKVGKQKRTIHYQWTENVPIRDTADALEVGWVEVTVIGADGRKIYRNAFITNHELSKETVAEIVAAGRARWKIENEDINTLKTKGYNLEHNFGHGKSHLSETLATLNMLAFLFHTVLDMRDARYTLLRTTRGRRTRFFQELGTIACYWQHTNWDALILFMIVQLKLPDPGG